MTKNKILNIRVDESDLAMIDHSANRLRQTKSSIVLESVRYVTEHWEDFVSWFLFNDEKEP